MSSEKKIPRHVAIIMDGNGRWAESRGEERYVGHMQGVESVRTSVKAALKSGVEYLTLYAFSTENWGRPAEEVSALMEILCRSIIEETPELKKQGVRVRMIGDRSRFSPKVQEHLALIEEQTSGEQKLTLILALNYSSRSELVRAVQLLSERVAAGELSVAEIDEKAISESLYTSFCPDPDLIIRTSGECRLSNFLLWQASYAEFYFPEVLWPDFTEQDFTRALEVYASRDRRFGLVKTDTKK
ncbi:MAG: isoprenyl transferase [Rikenellaceae bacterium]|nr:isoprenyl transferase [Rikenellaceae bacterium]